MAVCFGHIAQTPSRNWKEARADRWEGGLTKSQAPTPLFQELEANFFRQGVGVVSFTFWLNSTYKNHSFTLCSLLLSISFTLCSLSPPHLFSYLHIPSLSIRIKDIAIHILVMQTSISFHFSFCFFISIFIFLQEFFSLSICFIEGLIELFFIFFLIAPLIFLIAFKARFQDFFIARHAGLLCFMITSKCKV